MTQSAESCFLTMTNLQSKYLYSHLPPEYQHPYGPVQLPLKLQCQAFAPRHADDALFADAAGDMAENHPCLRSPLDIVTQSNSIA